MKVLLLLFVTSGLGLFPSLSMAQETKSGKVNYVGITAGRAFLQDLESYERNLHFSLPDVGLSDAFILGVRVGHTPQIWSRMTPIVVEVEGSMITQTEAESDPFFLHPIGSTVDFTADVGVRDVMLNFCLRHPYGGIHPYGGFGLGWAWFDLENASLTLEPGFLWPETGTRVNEQGDLSEDAFAYQFLLGVTFDVTETISVDLGYRYFVTEPEFKLRRTSYPEIANPVDFDIRMTMKAHVIALGVALWF